MDGVKRTPPPLTAAKGKAPASPNRQPKQGKITTKRVLKSASKSSLEPGSSSDEDGMQEERRVSVNTPSTDFALDNA
jgi:hypothetical protein